MNALPHFHIELPTLLDIPKREVLMILAARSWCLLRRSRMDPLPRIAEYLNSQIAAMRFAVLMDALQQVWPEPFTVHRPCCQAASADELLLCRIIGLANAQQRPAFDALLREMLGSEARDLIYARAQTLNRDVLA